MSERHSRQHFAQCYAGYLLAANSSIVDDTAQRATGKGVRFGGPLFTSLTRTGPPPTLQYPIPPWIFTPAQSDYPLVSLKELFLRRPTRRSGSDESMCGVPTSHWRRADGCAAGRHNMRRTGKSKPVAWRSPERFCAKPSIGQLRDKTRPGGEGCRYGRGDLAPGIRARARRPLARQGGDTPSALVEHILDAQSLPTSGLYGLQNTRTNKSPVSCALHVRWTEQQQRMGTAAGNHRSL